MVAYLSFGDIIQKTNIRKRGKDMANKIILSHIFSNSRYLKKDSFKEELKKDIKLETTSLSNYQTNLGHEMINLFQDDNGHFNVWLNANGIFNNGKKSSTYDIVFVTKVTQEEKIYQIVAKAINCKIVEGADLSGDNKEQQHQRYELQKGKYCYNGVYLEEIYGLNQDLWGNAEKNTLVTFQSDGIYLTKEKHYLVFSNFNNQSIQLTSPYIQITSKQQFSENLRLYNFEQEDIDNLNKIINNNDLWENKPVSKLKDEYQKLLKEKQNWDNNVFSYINIQKYELPISNIIASFLKKYHMEKNFIQEVCKIKVDNILLYREKYNIDLLFEGSDHFLIFENKIHASITKANSKTLAEQIEKIVETFDEVTSQNLMEQLKNDIPEEEWQKEASQLSKYYITMLCYALTKKGKSIENIQNNLHFYIVFPTYKASTLMNKDQKLNLSQYALSQYYQVLDYQIILNFFKNHQKEFKESPIYNDFIDLLTLFSKDRDEEIIRLQKSILVERIEKIKKK